jgi:hypothetical protein
MSSASFETIVAKAAKRFEQTGSLQGFKAGARSGSNEGVTGLSVSALATEPCAGGEGTVITYTFDVNRASGRAGTGQGGFSAQQIEELMDFLGRLRSAAAQKSTLRSEQPKHAPATVRTHARTV